jgi:hypothetical protein
MLTRVLNKLVQPFGLKCVPVPEILPAPELPDAYVENAQIVPERSDILRRLPKNGVVAEVGVGFGGYSRKIIDVMRPSKFVAIDTFDLDRTSWIGSNPYKKRFGGLGHEAYYRRLFANEITASLVAVEKGFSNQVLEKFPDSHFDMIYIDAAHDYASVKADLEVSNRKIKRDGYIVLNDFTIMDPLLLQHYDIVRAVQEFCLEESWEIAYFALHRFMFCDIALRKLRAAGA